MAEYEQIAKSYIAELEQNVQAGNATESTHRPALKTFIQGLANGITATNEPKHVECGAPDYVISRKRKHGPLTVGHIETKNIDAALQAIESDSKRAQPKTDEGKQIKRYRGGLPNLVLTDYLEFRWYVEGELRLTARLAEPGRGGKLSMSKEGSQDVEALLKAFLERAPEPVAKPKELAVRMARLSQFIRDIIVEAFDKDLESEMLRELHKAFEDALIPDLKIPQFADMFAQTLAYGLFAARVNHGEGRRRFRRVDAAAEIPKTNPFLRRLFDKITGLELEDEPFAGFVEDLTQLLADTDIRGVLADFGKRSRKQDPVLHFYETFLTAYDPKLREKRGVYYTPEPVVSYIVRSVDHLLKTRFGCPDGLADTSKVDYQRTDAAGKTTTEKQPRVLVLDPACGTGTFLYAAVDLIREQFMQQENAGKWSGYVRDHLLPRMFGFELLMAPYAVAHLKLGLQLAGQDLSEAQRAKWAYDFSGNERLGVYLTNTLEEAKTQSELLFASWITDEANAAAAVKRELPIMVVFGNPPYSGQSANASYRLEKETVREITRRGKKIKLRQPREVVRRVPTFIGGLLRDYYQVDGQPLGERNPKWLQDDYVKFLRFGQWRVEQTGAGVLAFITNHGYLDNPTFRGMRQQLMNSFTDIFILDLHGNDRKKERAPDGGPDKNVFDIRQGVAIGIFVKEPGKSTPANVHHKHLWGLREEKYSWLFEKDLSDTEWVDLNPQTPFYLFTPQDANLRTEYERGWKVTEIIPVNSVGIVTGQDAATVAANEAEAATFAKRLEVALTAVRPLLYRPFDVRFVVYDAAVVTWPRTKVMRHMLAGENLALVTSRMTKGEAFRHAQVTRNITEVICMSPKTSNNGFVFPLYLYPTDHDKPHVQKEMRGLSPWPEGKDGRRPNLDPDFVVDLERRWGLTFMPDARGDLKTSFGPEDVFHYIYAVLHSPTYRSRYADFLKIDFPRVPLTSDVDILRTLAARGAELVSLHLMESPALAKSITHYPVSGPDTVEAGHPKYLAPGDPEPGTGEPLKEGRVYISKDDSKTGKKGQYFGGVPQEVWQFQVGGYQVCEKWLKDRRRRPLDYDDKTHYERIVVALKETIRLMEEIDAAIPSWPLE